MKTKALIIVMTLLAGIFFFQCESDDEVEEDEKVELTQDKLDKATSHLGDFTGQNFAHGGPEGISADSTIREVYGNVDQVGSSIEKGTLITKRTYKKNPDGSNGQLFVTFAMFKRESGYDSENADWEYVQMPADESIDYTEHPNGLLSEESVARGKLDGCISCHGAASGNDYLFTND
ncbi:MAG: cytochrome P460 family protein [Bacteroidales bacterium]|nr:cytochrome P460 family protein [Bacteroidales bacterium]MBS3776060.1 cytochrome P460 family protein [Bacteroidales bacterium]